VVLLSLATAGGVYFTQDQWVPLVQKKGAEPTPTPAPTPPASNKSGKR
jgi:eukaryotic-like serine/threonine-protein kinase